MKSVSRVFKVAAVCLIGVPAVVGAHMGINQLIGNFHEVLPGELYRSAQPDGQDIAYYAREKGIKTIINLRDEDRDEWQAMEHKATSQAGIQLIEFPMSSAKELPRDKAEKLAELMRTAQKPVLIHCEHGANRTGLASAIYVAAVANKGEAAAEFQLSPYYGHIPIKGIGRYAMYSSWDKFEETIGL